MNEGFPVSEGGEEINSESVVESIKQKGISDPETQELFLKWLDQEQEKVSTSKEGMFLNKKIADIYRDGGMKDQAIEAYKDVSLQAWNEGEDSFYHELQKEIENLN